MRLTRSGALAPPSGMNMTKISTIMAVLFAALFMQSANATPGELPCGWYELRGTIEKNQEGTGYFYIVNKGTLSEVKLVIPYWFEPKAAPYIERFSKVRARFTKPLSGYRGEFYDVESFELVAYDPLGYSRAKTVAIISAEECTNQSPKPP